MDDGAYSLGARLSWSHCISFGHGSLSASDEAGHNLGVQRLIHKAYRHETPLLCTDTIWCTCKSMAVSHMTHAHSLQYHCVMEDRR